MQRFLSFKFLIMAGLIFGFLVCFIFMRGIVYERQQYSQNVIAEIGRDSVRAQRVMSPFIIVPISERTPCIGADYTNPAVKADASSPNTAKPTAIPLPCVTHSQLLITPQQAKWTHAVDVTDQKYARGVYRATSYTDQIQLNADFIPSEALLKPTAQQTIHWEQAKMLLPISDLRGLYRQPVLTIGTEKRLFEIPTDGSNDFFRAPYTELTIGLRAKDPLTIQLDLALDGLTEIAIQPLGKNTQMSMQANWPHPQFGGDALPQRKTILADQFSAEWQNSYLAIHNTQLLNACIQNRQPQACQQFNTGKTTDAAYAVNIDAAYAAADAATIDAAYAAADAAMGDIQSLRIGFVDPINIYSLTDRTLKYAALFLVLIFGIFFLFEILKDLRVHPIQYALVGAAQAVFYLLLLSFSEQFAFAWAYLGSSIACVLLITWYVSYVLRGIKRALGLGVIVTSLYATLYVILQSQQHTLILGSVLVFVVITLVMYLTRHIDWYQLGSKPA